MPSRSAYQNVFFYYRGPTPKAASDEQAEQALDIQLEDNATKASINLLECSAPSLTTSFLNQILGENVVEGPRHPFVYSLQGADRSARDAEHRYLVGISMLGKAGLIQDEANDPQPVGRVDAAIHRANDLVVFEAKVGSSDLQARQFGRHAKKWKITKSGWRFVRWPDLYEWVERELTTKGHGEVTSFLLEQFVKFLELTELAPFRGFREEDFDFFNMPTLEQRPVVKNRLAALGENVLNLLTEPERDAVGELHVGQLGEDADHAWLHTHEGQDVGSGSAVLPTLEGPYDLVFSDGDPEEMPFDLQHVLRLLRPGGLLVSANLFLAQFVPDLPGIPQMAEYRGRILEDDRLLTAMIPGGLALSVVRG